MYRHVPYILLSFFRRDPQADPKKIPYGMDNDETQVVAGVYVTYTCVHVIPACKSLYILLSVISSGHDDEDDDVIIVEPHKSILTCSQSDMEDQL